MCRGRMVFAAGIALTLALAGCSSILGNDEPWCPSGDPAPFGCVRLVILVDGPAEPWPALRKLGIWASSVSPEYPGIDASVWPDSAGAIPLVVVDHLYPIDNLPDTLSMLFVAKLMEVPSPPITGQPLPVFAVDSVLHVVDFTVRRVDTLRLTLRRR